MAAVACIASVVVGDDDAKPGGESHALAFCGVYGTRLHADFDLASRGAFGAGGSRGVAFISRRPRHSRGVFGARATRGGLSSPSTSPMANSGPFGRRSLAIGLGGVHQWASAAARAVRHYNHDDAAVDIKKHLDPYVDKRYDANVAQLRKATATTDAKAKAAAAEAKQASKRVQELLKQNEDLLAKAKDFSKEAELSVKDAEASDKKMEEELAKAKEYAKVAEAGAKELAKKAVDDLFMGKYRELDGWRKE
ncbi:bPT2, partial [Symbiodinium sp. CCMP2456]